MARAVSFQNDAPIGRRVNAVSEASYLLLDGGMGTMLQAAGLPLGEMPEAWNLTHPGTVEGIHRKYAEAGSRVLYANTFGANRFKAARSGYTVGELVSAGVRCARAASGAERKVALPSAGRSSLPLRRYSISWTGKLAQKQGAVFRLQNGAAPCKAHLEADAVIALVEGDLESQAGDGIGHMRDVGGFVERLAVEHDFPCCGYLFSEGSRRIAYISDCHELPDETIERVKGVDVMVLNCLRERQHPTHLSLERALGYLDQIAPKRAYLVHMCHDLTHKDWLARLAGTNVEPAYDGLKLNIGDKQ